MGRIYGVVIDNKACHLLGNLEKELCRYLGVVLLEKLECLDDECGENRGVETSLEKQGSGSSNGAVTGTDVQTLEVCLYLLCSL